MIAALQTIVNAMPDDAHPKDLKEAHAFESAIAEMLTTAQVVEPLNPAAITTASEAKKAIDAAVAHDVGNESRVRHIKTLLPVAAARVEAAQQASAGAYIETFRKDFDTAAGRLYALIEKRGPIDPETVEVGKWNFDPALSDMRETLADLTRLGAVRDAYVYRGGSNNVAEPPMSIPYERNSRVAVFDDYAASQRFEDKAGGIHRHGARWFVIAAQTPGVRLRWQELTEQRAQPAPAHVARERAALAANQR